MVAMHAQGGLPIPGIAHINQPHWYSEGGDMTPEEFGLARARENDLERAIDAFRAGLALDIHLGTDGELGDDDLLHMLEQALTEAEDAKRQISTMTARAEELCDEGEHAFDDGDFRRASDAFTAGLAEEIQDQELIARLEAGLEKSDAALRAASKQVQDAQAQLAAGQESAATHRYDEAIAAFEAGIAIDADDVIFRLQSSFGGRCVIYR